MVGKADAMGRTPLHYAAQARPFRPEDLSSLIASGWDVNAIDNQGWTPLAFASQAGNSQAAAQLIEAGSAVDTADSTGNTPLWRAVFNFSQGDVVEVLLTAGADPDHLNQAGVSPRMLAHKVANNNASQYF